MFWNALCVSAFSSIRILEGLNESLSANENSLEFCWKVKSDDSWDIVRNGFLIWGDSSKFVCYLWIFYCRTEISLKNDCVLKFKASLAAFKALSEA